MFYIFVLLLKVSISIGICLDRLFKNPAKALSMANERDDKFIPNTQTNPH